MMSTGGCLLTRTNIQHTKQKRKLNHVNDKSLKLDELLERFGDYRVIHYSSTLNGEVTSVTVVHFDKKEMYTIRKKVD